ncbi:hypothetical protein T11_17557 [Trichinella zimbabwensis]|uniref:Uncharacterized protein n=1 Tax=Trichinella zimbabwensis TaxID=268475 RepID=A0A0V1I3N2_9BILA|nr:hypothetical protein T11_17557 [Trichinella zimbabwensis]
MMCVDDENGDSVVNAKEPECQEGITVDTVVTSQRGVVFDQVVVCRCLEDCLQCVCFVCAILRTAEREPPCKKTKIGRKSGVIRDHQKGYGSELAEGVDQPVLLVAVGCWSTVVCFSALIVILTLY